MYEIQNRVFVNNTRTNVQENSSVTRLHVFTIDENILVTLKREVDNRKEPSWLSIQLRGQCKKKATE